MTSRPVDIRQVKRNFSRQADAYDRHAVVQKRVAERLLELILKDGPVGGRVLEVGSGTGYLTRRLIGNCPEAHPLVSDLAHGMTREAARNSGAPAIDADAQNLPLRERAVSLVCSSSVYQWVNDLPGAFGESARVLAPGGRFCFALFGAETLFELRESHRRAVAEAGGNLPSHVQEFPTEGMVLEALVQAGFKDIRILSEQEVERHGDVPELLRSLKGIGASNASAFRPSGLASRRVMTRMMALYRERFGADGDIPATYHVIYGLAVKPKNP